MCYDAVTASVRFAYKSAVSDECLWYIRMTNGGLLIKNKATEKYLYVSGTSLKLSSTASSASYWRAISTSKYGDSSGYAYRELSGFLVTRINVDLGKTKTITISKFPVCGSPRLWTSLTDFTYSVSSGANIVSVTSGGVVTGKSLGEAKILIKHKPTGLTYTATVLVTNDATLLGVKDADTKNHDHSSVLLEAKTLLGNSSYDYDTINYKHQLNFDKYDVIEMLEYSELFISRSHGNVGGDEYDDTTYILIKEQNVYPTDRIYGTDLYSWEHHKPKHDMSNMKICVFVGCLTASSDVAHGLARSAYKAGASASVGFSEEIWCSSANSWTKRLVHELVNGYTIDSACYLALHNGNYALNMLGNMDSYYVYGNGEQGI